MESPPLSESNSGLTFSSGLPIPQSTLATLPLTPTWEMLQVRKINIIS